MALVLLHLLYLALAGALAALAGRLGRPWPRRAGDEGGAAGRGDGRVAAGRWPSLVAVLVLTLLPLAFTARGFLPGTTLSPTPLLTGVPPWAEPERVEVMQDEPANPLLLDPLVQFLPWREAARDDLLLNPAQGGGAALLANGQSAVLYPTEVLARLLTPFRATTFSQAARLLVAGWGMFLLAAALLVPAFRRGDGEGVSVRRGGFAAVAPAELAALAAAAAWVGCGFVQVWRLHPHSLVAATVPWVLFALVRLVRRPGPGAAVGLAAAGAVAVAGGHPETLLHALLFGLLLAALVAWTDRLPGAAGPDAAEAARRAAGPVAPRLARAAAWGAAAALLAALLAAPLLLPFVENLRVSSEWVLRRDSGTVVEVAPAESFERLRPTFALYALGDPRVAAEEEPDRTAGEGAANEGADGGSWLDRWLDPGAEPWSGPENLSELAGGWVGSVALFFAFLSLGHGSPRRRRLARALLLVGAVGLLVSVHLAFLSWPFGEVPLLRESLLKRLSIWWALAASLAAGLGFGRWVEGRVLFFRPPLLAWAAAAMALSLAAGGPFNAVAAVTLWEWLPLLAVAVAVWRLPWIGAADAAGRRLERAVVAAVFTLLVLPPVALLAGWVPAVSSAGFYAETLATRFVADRLAEEPGEGYRVAGLEAALVPHSASFFGFEEARAYDPMTYAPYAEFMAHAGEPTVTGWTRLTNPGSAALAFLGVRWVFEHPSSGEREGVEVAFRGHGGMVYENPRALPRVFVPRSYQLFPTPEEAVAAAGGVGDFAHRVTVARLAGPPASGEPTARDPTSNGRARLRALSVGPRRVAATVVAEMPALTATSQPSIPGWRVLVDGEEVAPVAVNGAFLGAIVPAGEHDLELVYAPRSWALGLWLAAGGLLACAALLWMRRWLSAGVAGRPAPAAVGTEVAEEAVP